MFVIISDYDASGGGAGRVAEIEAKMFPEGTVTHFYNKKLPTTSLMRFSLQIIWSNITLSIFVLKNILKIKRIFVHTWSLFPIVIILNKFLRNKLIFILHDYKLTCPSKAEYDFNLEHSCTLRGGSARCLVTDCGYSKVKKLASSLEVKFLGKVNKVRCLSTKSQNILKKSQKSNSNYVVRNIFTFHDGNEGTELRLPEPYVLFAGRYTKDKGADTYFDIAKSMSVIVGENNNDQNYKRLSFVSCGGGPLCPNDNVTDLGWLPGGDVAHLIKRARIVIYPSRQIDCDPLIFQACAFFGTPMMVFSQNAIASDVEKMFGKSYVVDDNMELSLKNALKLHQHSRGKIDYPASIMELYPDLKMED